MRLVNQRLEQRDRLVREETAVIGLLRVARRRGGNDGSERSPEIETALRADVFDALDLAVAEALKQVTIEQLVLSAERRKSANAGMFYI